MIDHALDDVGDAPADQSDGGSGVNLSDAASDDLKPTGEVGE
jgi:hypothetical protein